MHQGLSRSAKCFGRLIVAPCACSGLALSLSLKHLATVEDRILDKRNQHVGAIEPDLAYPRAGGTGPFLSLAC